MERIQALLVYVDPEANRSSALERALTLAREHSCRVVVVTAVEDWPFWSASLLRDGLSFERYVQDVEDSLRRLVADTASSQDAVETRLLRGKPALEIAKESIRGKYDILIKDSTEPEGDDNVSSSDFDRKLLRKCACPVWLIRKGHPEMDIGVAIAPQSDESAVAFSRELIEYAIGFAAILDKPLHVIQSWDLFGETYLIRNMSTAEYEDYMARYEQALVEEFDKFLKDFGMSTRDERVHFLKNEPVPGIVSAANGLMLDTLIVGTIARGGLSGHLLGNTVEQIIDLVDSNVLGVKPADWICPVTL